MCIRVSQVDIAVDLASYDSDSITIYIRRTADPVEVMAEIRAILADLDAPPAAPGALCFCGDPIALPPELHAAQQAGRHDDRRQVLRGA